MCDKKGRCSTSGSVPQFRTVITIHEKRDATGQKATFYLAPASTACLQTTKRSICRSVKPRIRAAKSEETGRFDKSIVND
ncbi:hypothetical protein KM043_005021 [Ampulex compressa]|nr:hypothetical protein KM043_005021 [Ampulex compressa]